MTVSTMKEPPLTTEAAARGAEVAARRAARARERADDHAVEAARREVSAESMAARFAAVARTLAEAIDRHASAAGILLDPEAPVGPNLIEVRIRGAERGRPRLRLQRIDAVLRVTLRGASRGEEWAPIDLDAAEFDPADVAARCFRDWAAEVEGAETLRLAVSA
jgi:hypothetical protein